jgi:hypothetical protein
MTLPGSVRDVEVTRACGDDGELLQGPGSGGGAHHGEGDDGRPAEREKAPMRFAHAKQREKGTSKAG